MMISLTRTLIAFLAICLASPSYALQGAAAPDGPQRYICLFETKEPSRLYTSVINVSVPNDFSEKERLFTKIEHAFAAHVTGKNNIADWVALAAGQPECRPSRPGWESESLEYTVNYYHKYKPDVAVVNTDWVYNAK